MTGDNDPLCNIHVYMQYCCTKSITTILYFQFNVRIKATEYFYHTTAIQHCNSVV